MPVKDRIVTWFIQHVLAPKIEIIDNPGFVVNTLSDRTKTTFLREFFLPERLFEIIENNVVNKHGELGKKVLYSCGKKFGYIYSSLSEFPTIHDSTEKKISDFMYNLIRYFETFYASNASHELDIENKILKAVFNNYIICRHNGLGYIMMDGGAAGIWAYVMQDKTLEAIQVECQGRGEKDCKLFCAPKEKIQKINKKFYTEENICEIQKDEIYNLLNKVRKTTYAQNSMKDLIDIHFFDYSRGVVSFKQNRFFSCDAHILYILENEIKNLPDGETLLFDSCFEFGKELQKLCGENEYKKFIMDFFPALGFGDIFVTSSHGIQIISEYYPWTIYSEKSNYIIFRGILSGFISSATDVKTEFNHVQIDVKEYLTLSISV